MVCDVAVLAWLGRGLQTKRPPGSLWLSAQQKMADTGLDMPIPALQNETAQHTESAAAEQNARTNLVLLQGGVSALPQPAATKESPKVSSFSHPQSLHLSERIYAFAFDAMLVGGFSLWAAKWVNVAMLSLFQKDFLPHGESGAREFFLAAQDFSFSSVFSVSFLLLGFVYYVLSLTLVGRSLGQGLLGLRVMSHQGGTKPSVAEAWSRTLLVFLGLASAGLLFLMPWLWKRGELLQDVWSGTHIDRQ